MTDTPTLRFECGDRVRNPDGTEGTVIDQSLLRFPAQDRVRWDDGTANWWDDDDPSLLPA
jgi:hypothetical protein